MPLNRFVRTNHGLRIHFSGLRFSSKNVGETKGLFVTADPDDMPRVDLANDPALRDKLAYAKQIEAKNFLRAVRGKKKLIKSRISFTVLWAIAIGIYSYTIIKIKEETFLDDFDEPPREKRVGS